MRVRKIKWSEEREPTPECRYTHIHGDNPIGGVILISWKGWKTSPIFEIEEGILGRSECFESLADAMATAQARFDSLVNECIVPG